ncbi:hypothetical protein [Cryptosporangium sp. NPDC048952]|uniref:hypothetical protein n=1 Tax=Cryptosporangium sp. NPDC048952 TaxID=3363961 RepID=UPI00371C1612
MAAQHDDALRAYYSSTAIPESAAADLVRLVHGVLPRPDGTATADAATLLSALRMLRALREELADWEPRLIDAARASGVSWNDLAPALGVASRQAAERRYLRLRPARPDEAGDTRDRRVQNERDRRAENRAVADWARQHAAGLRQLAARVADLRDLPEPAQRSVEEVRRTLGDDDSAALLGPLLIARDALADSHPELTRAIGDVIDRTDVVRGDTRHNRKDL